MKRIGLLNLLVAALCVAGFAGHAQALPFLDAGLDFLPTYSGPKDSDLDVLSPGLVPLPNMTVAISGNQITATVPLALFPSQSFKLKEYTYNVWPRSELTLANTVVSDFAHDNGNPPVSIAGKRARFDSTRRASSSRRPTR